MSKYWAAFVAYLKATFTKEKIVAFFKTKFVEKVVVILFKAAPKGFYGWVVNLVVSKLYTEIGEPLIEAGLRKVGFIYQKIDGKILIKKLKKAQGEGNEDEFDSISTDILS